jgi:hypothetical protein
MQQTIQQLLANAKANQVMLARMEAHRESDREQIHAEIRARMDANTREMNAEMDTNQAKLTKQEEMLAEINARMDVNTKEIIAKMEANQAEIRPTVYAMRSELKETIQHGMKAVMQPIRSKLDETTACREATDTEPNPGIMQSIEEHQGISKEDDAVMLVGRPR